MEFVSNIDYGDSFIGIVKGYNINTRELDVYIPKLMPAIAEDQKDVKVMTNYGSTIEGDAEFSSEITLTGTIKVKARNINEKLPKIGSRVQIYFFEENLSLGFWLPFNPNGDYEVIDSEKYDPILHLEVNTNSGNMTKTLYNLDHLIINLPDIFEPTLLYNNKTAELNLNLSNDFLERISALENLLGTPEMMVEDNSIFNNALLKYSSTGIFARIEALEKKIKEIEDSL